MALEQELETFKNNLQTLKAEHEGKYVLIHGDQVIDVFSSYDDAIKAGYGKFGLNPFLVKQIHALEHAQFVSRFVDPCTVRRAV